MVDPVTPISATGPSAAVRIDRSTSITSEPDNALVAARQSQITAQLLELAKHDQEKERKAEEDEGAARHDDHHSDSRHLAAAHIEGEDINGEEAEASTLSGESERIGTVNFDDDTPFGDRVAII